MTEAQLLDWMTHHHLTLSLYRNEDGEWEVSDNASGYCLGSGETCFDALTTAYNCPTSTADAAIGGGFDPHN